MSIASALGISKNGRVSFKLYVLKKAIPTTPELSASRSLAKGNDTPIKECNRCLQQHGIGECVIPFVCGSPFLLFILSAMWRPTARAGALDRAFRDQTDLAKEVMAVGEMIVEDEGVATQDNLEKLEQVLSRLSVEMEKAMGAGANRFEIFHYVEMSLKEELGEHGVLNRDIRRRVNEFIEANRI